MKDTKKHPKGLYHYLRNAFWICILIWFIWAIYISPSSEATPEEIERLYLGLSYGKDSINSNSYRTVSVSSGDAKISYSISDDCSDYMKYRIRRSFVILFEKTNSLLSFIETITDANIEIDCHLYPAFSEDVITVGEATPGVIGYFVDEARISFYNMLSDSDAWYMGVCEDYPDTEIHEILHTFGFDHNSDNNSIMAKYIAAKYSGECFIDSIDKYIIDCLKYTYTDGGMGVDCSNRSDVIGNLEYQEYEECDNGWYDATNTNKFCCPYPNMYIDNKGYCSSY